METNEFFRLDQELWYSEFVDAEVSEIMASTDIHDENFFIELDV